MKLDADMLPKLATVLEKLADYVEQTESGRITEERDKRAAAAKTLAEKIGSLTGENLDETVIEKLASLDPEVAEMIGKFAGESTGVDSMGGPEDRDTEKTASATESADSRFMRWVTGP